MIELFTLLTLFTLFTLWTFTFLRCRTLEFSFFRAVLAIAC